MKGLLNGPNEWADGGEDPEVSGPIPTPDSPSPVRLTRQLVWFFSAATERDPEMMNCVGKREGPVRLWLGH